MNSNDQRERATLAQNFVLPLPRLQFAPISEERPNPSEGQQEQQASGVSRVAERKNTLWGRIFNTQQAMQKVKLQKRREHVHRVKFNILRSVQLDEFDSDEVAHDKKNFGERILTSPQVQMLLLVITFYSLFSDDYQTLVCPKAIDYLFDGTAIFVFLVFALEILITSIWRMRYFHSYYFYLDCVSTFSILLDLSWVTVAIQYLKPYSGPTALWASRR